MYQISNNVNDFFVTNTQTLKECLSPETRSTLSKVNHFSVRYLLLLGFGLNVYRPALSFVASLTPFPLCTIWAIHLTAGIALLFFVGHMFNGLQIPFLTDKDLQTFCLQNFTVLPFERLLQGILKFNLIIGMDKNVLFQGQDRILCTPQARHEPFPIEQSNILDSALRNNRLEVVKTIVNIEGIEIPLTETLIKYMEYLQRQNQNSINKETVKQMLAALLSKETSFDFVKPLSKNASFRFLTSRENLIQDPLDSLFDQAIRLPITKYIQSKLAEIEEFSKSLLPDVLIQIVKEHWGILDLEAPLLELQQYKDLKKSEECRRKLAREAIT